MGRSVRWSRRQPQLTRLCGHARLHGRPRARRSLCRTGTRTPVCAIHRTPAAQAQNRSNADHRGAKLHPECLKAIEGAAKLCQSLGHIVEEADPKLDMVALRPMNVRITAANTARACNLRWEALGRTPNPDDVEAGTWAVYQRGLKVSGVEYDRPL